MLIDNKYEIIKELGRGAQGEVLLVKKSGSNRIFALKTIRTSTTLDSNEANAIFINEFKLIKNLEHRNIIRVHDFGVMNDGSRCYYTMDYIDGHNLYDFLGKDNITPDVLTDVIYQILSGLNYLHANGVFHFDIKPENILVSRSGDKLQVRLVDFGLAGLSSLDRHKIRGTLCYMAPELFIPNSRITHKIDLYSLGVTILTSVMNKRTAPTSLSISGFMNKTRSVINYNIQLLNELSDRQLKDFLQLLTEPDPVLRINSAYDAIASLNTIYRKNYPLPTLWSLESCEHNSRFLVREPLFKELVGDSHAGNVLISGDSGSGLTRLLQRINYHLSLSLLKVIYFDNNDPEGKPLVKLRQESAAILTSLLKNEPGSFLNGLIDYNDENLQTEEIISLIIKRQPLYILIDDFNRYDKDFTSLITTLAAQQLDSCRIIATLTENSNLDKQDLQILLLQRDRNFSQIKLPPLKRENADELLAGLFGKIINLPDNFIQLLVNTTAGNFRLIMQKLDLLIKNKIITGYNDLYIYADPEKQAEKLLSAGLEKQKQPLHVRKIINFLLLAPLGLPREQLALQTGLDIFKLQNQLDRLISRGQLRSRTVNNRKYYFLPDRFDYIKVLTAIAAGKEKFLLPALQETILVLPNRSVEELLYQQILEVFNKTDQDIYKVWPAVQANTEPRVRLFYLSIAPYFINDPVLKINLLYELIRELIKREIRKPAIPLLKNFKKLTADTRISGHNWQYIHLQMLLHDDIYYSIKPTLFLKEFDLLLNKLDFTEFVNIGIKMVESFLQSRYTAESGRIMSRVKAAISERAAEFRFFSYLLTSYEIFYSLIPWEDKHLDLIESHLDDFVEHNVFTGEYFKTLYNYISYFTLFKNRSDQTRFVKYLQQGLIHARDTQNSDFLLMLSNHLGLYYRNTGQDAAAIKIYENILNNEKKVKHLNRSNIFNNLALIKYDLQLPVSEVQYLFEEACAEQRRYASLSSYSIQLSNISVLNYEAGNFEQSARFLDEQLSYFPFLGTIYHAPLLNYVPKYSASFIRQDELTTKLQTVYTGDFSKIADRIAVCYDYVHNNNIEIFYPPEWLQGDGVFRLETLEILIYLTVKNKKLPEQKTVFQTVTSQFTADNRLENHLIYQMVRYIYTPGEQRLSTIIKLLQSLQVNGYRWIICQHLTRFLFFITIMKIQIMEAPVLYKMLHDNLEMIIGRCSLEQQSCFKKIYLVKTAAKLLKKHYCDYNL